ncbi:MAG: TonB-dependent receptor [Hyphomonadaceae bacterium]
MRRITKLLAGAALGLTAIPSVALAQDAPVAEESPDEIVVTARKREERLQDVPIAVTAVTAETLENQQVNSVREVAAYAPGLNITTDAVGRAFLSIRGVGTTLIDTVQPGVGIFVDGIYQPNTSYLNNPVFDVARIEVLRGPQGTLFGNNTLGGAISVITRPPTDEFEGRISGVYADPDNYQTLSASISGPIIDGVLRGRIGAAYHSHDGFSTNLLAGGDARPMETESVTGSLVWDAPQGAQITLNAYYNNVEGSQTAYSSPAGPTDYVQDTSLNENSIAQYEYTGVNVRGVFDVTGNTQMTTILAYDQKVGSAQGDGDFGPVDFIRVRDGRNVLETFTGETRFDTHWSDNVSTLIGVFASHSDSDYYFVNNLVASSTPLVLVPLPPSRTVIEQSSAAIFGTLFWNITDSLELAAGLRFDHQEVASSASVGQYSADEWQPRLTLTQHWTDNWMTYASVSRGFRGGGANSAGAPNPFYQGDSVWTYEIGNKFTTADNTLTLNASIYYNDYQHYIGQNSLTPALIAVNLNTGDVESYGFELEGNWRPTDIFALQGGLTYNHARITDDSEYAAVIGHGLPSDRILFQPDWNFFVTPSVTFDVGPGQLRLDTTVVYKGDRAGSSLSPTFAPMLDGYYLVNANIAYSLNDWTVALWGTNLTDEEYYDSYLDRSLLGALFGDASPITRNLGIMGDGRRVGVRASLRF